MEVNFTATNVVAMILFLPIIVFLGLIFAFTVPAIAIIVAVSALVLVGIYLFVKIRLLKKQMRDRTMPVSEYKTK
jgi:ABC-type multidrug transport system permease subunit